jgi:hypothetical protein
MEQLTTPLLAKACRIFLALAYPVGPESIPAKKRYYQELPEDKPVGDFLPPAACASGICQTLTGDHGALVGYALRLGSSGFPHLKLQMRHLMQNNQAAIVFMVDTHDAFSKENRVPPADHPDAPQWLELQKANRALKEKIEAAFEQHGLATLNSILRDDLEN